jgi:hypothetical protein
MNGSSTQTFETPTRGRRYRWNIEVVAVIVCVGLALMAISWISSTPSRIEVMSVSNPSEYRIAVTVGPAVGGGSLSALQSVEAGSTRVYRDVLDKGDRWAFTFSSQGVEAGVLVLDRSVLESQGWAVEVPQGAIDALRSAQVPVPPRTAERGP